MHDQNPQYQEHAHEMIQFHSYWIKFVVIRDGQQPAFMSTTMDTTGPWNSFEHRAFVEQMRKMHDAPSIIIDDIKYMNSFECTEEEYNELVNAANGAIRRHDVPCH